MSYPAIFLDRDGTLVYSSHYPSRPECLRLYEGICPKLQTLQQAGFKLIVVTNQAGIARGYFTESDLSRMHDYLTQELSRGGVSVDGIYYCPHHPDGIVPELRLRCSCRKPQPGMVLQAAREHQLDLQHSWMVGDILDDIEAGNRAGCTTVLVDLGTEHSPTGCLRTPDYVARDTLHALSIISALEGLGPPTSLTYRPASWQIAEPSLYPSNRDHSGQHVGVMHE